MSIHELCAQYQNMRRLEIQKLSLVNCTIKCVLWYMLKCWYDIYSDRATKW